MDFFGCSYIKRDLKRLKRIKSLKEDVENHFKIFRGVVNDRQRPQGWPFTCGVADYLFEIEIGDKTFYFYKARQATTNPSSGTAKGVRIIFCVDGDRSKYIPFLVFEASEEDTKYHAPDNRDYLLKGQNFKSIIEAKIRYI